LTNLPICNFVAAANLAITKTNTPAAGPNDQAADTVNSGANTVYTLVVTNTGPNAVNGALVADTPGAGIACPAANVVTCTSPTAGVCPAGPLTVANLTAGIALGNLPATVGSNTATFTFTCSVL
jgi:uncharacterized repeat protein (TIGR01451 family)